ncbi:MAG: hypothetical protein U5K79_02205 [Cyclobacteriaceae bacterium]|nr:hypothetical protein [Cyclobacteriaceae bacterium]
MGISGTSSLCTTSSQDSCWSLRQDQYGRAAMMYSIPNTEAGTRFSLVDLAGKGPWPAARLYSTWNINERHSLRGLLAPLAYTETGTFASPVDFAGESYAPEFLCMAPTSSIPGDSVTGIIL